MATNTELNNKPVKLEYIWLDHFGEIRSKTKIYTEAFVGPEDLPVWDTINFHSPDQGLGIEFMVLLKPVAIYPDPFRGGNHQIVLTEVLNLDNTPHYSNHRALAVEVEEKAKDHEPQFGIEQEYMIFSTTVATREGTQNKKTFIEKKRVPYGWAGHDDPREDEQTRIYISYLSVGKGILYGRDLAEEHLDHCLHAGLKIHGINAEANPSQWEYQIGVCGPVEMADHLTVSRYILHRLSEKYNASISLQPKPYKGDHYFGSGLHTNFSTKKMREGADGKKGIQFVEEACEKLCDPELHQKHMDVYGDNKERLDGTGLVVGSKDKCTWGKADKKTSLNITVPTIVKEKGYFEDRRPASNADPYRIAARMVQSVCLE